MRDARHVEGPEVASPATAAVTRGAAAHGARALQAAGGNRALARLVAEHGPTAVSRAPVRQLARKVATGMRRKDKIAAYSSNAVDFWRDPANAAKPLADYAAHLMALVNTDLRAMGAIDVPYVIDTAGYAAGTFSRGSWRIKLNPDEFSDRDAITTVGQLTAKEAAELAETVYHEARHSEQYFRIARVRAGRATQSDAGLARRIADEIGIPIAVANAAVAVPIFEGKDTKVLVAEADSWESITIGRHAEYKGIINDFDDEVRPLVDRVRDVTWWDADDLWRQIKATVEEWKTSDTHMGFLDPHLVATQAVAEKTEQDKRVIKVITAVQAAFAQVERDIENLDVAIEPADPEWNAEVVKVMKDPLRALQRELYQGYRSHVHEDDAHETGDAVNAEFLRQEKQRKKDEAKAQKEIEQAWGKLWESIGW